jgi:hypothetical protein
MNTRKGSDRPRVRPSYASCSAIFRFMMRMIAFARNFPNAWCRSLAAIRNASTCHTGSLMVANGFLSFGPKKFTSTVLPSLTTILEFCICPPNKKSGAWKEQTLSLHGITRNSYPHTAFLLWFLRHSVMSRGSEFGGRCLLSGEESLCPLTPRAITMTA